MTDHDDRDPHGASQSNEQEIKALVWERVEELLGHSGHGEIHIAVRWAKRGRREVILSGGSQQRLLLRQPTPTAGDRQARTTDRYG